MSRLFTLLGCVALGFGGLLGGARNLLRPGDLPDLPVAILHPALGALLLVVAATVLSFLALRRHGSDSPAVAPGRSDPAAARPSSRGVLLVVALFLAALSGPASLGALGLLVLALHLLRRAVFPVPRALLWSLACTAALGLGAGLLFDGFTRRAPLPWLGWPAGGGVAPSVATLDSLAWGWLVSAPLVAGLLELLDRRRDAGHNTLQRCLLAGGLPVLMLLAAAVVVLHDQPWTFNWGRHIHARAHMVGLAALVGAARLTLVLSEHVPAPRGSALRAAALMLPAAGCFELTDSVALAMPLILAGALLAWRPREQRRLRLRHLSALRRT